MRLFRATRQWIITEEVEVFANSFDEARELIENDDESVQVNRENEGDLEILPGSLIEIKE